MSSPTTMTIGRLAQGAGIGVETVRFYERKGLLEQPSRAASGYRQYPSGTLTRLRFIRQAKDLGFTLPEIKELLSLRVSPGASCAEVQERIQAKIDGIEEKISSLDRNAKGSARNVRDLSLRCPADKRVPHSGCVGERDGAGCLNGLRFIGLAR